MVNIKHLTKLADTFQLKAVAQQQDQLNQLFTAVNKRIIGMAAGLVSSIQHLLAKPKYQASDVLKTIKDQATQLLNLARSATSQNAIEIVPRYDEIIGNMSFYASSGNVGTGQNGTLNVREDGYTDPAYYVRNIAQLYSQIKGKYQSTEDPVKSKYIA
jgi:hypothetical protein